MKCEECRKETPTSLMQDLEDIRVCFKCYDKLQFICGYTKQHNNTKEIE